MLEDVRLIIAQQDVVKRAFLLEKTLKITSENVKTFKLHANAVNLMCQNIYWSQNIFFATKPSCRKKKLD
jgi:hypothetical protein